MTEPVECGDGGGFSPFIAKGKGRDR